MGDDKLHLMDWRKGEKQFSPFSDAKTKRRQDDLRELTTVNHVDPALFTSYHCIDCYSGWLYCCFGRKYGMVIIPTTATTISARDRRQPSTPNSSRKWSSPWS